MKEVNINKIMKKPVLIVTSLIITVLSLSILRVALVNNISTDGIELAELQNKISQYKKENILLEERYLEVAALVNIEYKAKSLGFVDAKSQIYLSTPLPLALK